MATWRETYKPARFFMLDARAGVPIIVVALHFRPWTVALATAVITLFWFLDSRGMTIMAAMRSVRAWVIGDGRPALPGYKIRGKIDYDRRWK